MPFPASLVQTLNNYRLQPYPSVTGLPQPITAQSIEHFLGALLWAWALLVCFTGWGRAAGKLLRIQQMPASIACSLGIAAILFVGGLLNLLHLIYPSTLFALVALGLLLYGLLRGNCPDAYRWRNLWYRCPRWGKLLLVLALAIMVLRVAGTVRLATFDSFDDGQAYLAFVPKMLAAHHFAFDPFSDRRLISSLGGAYLLQAMVVAATSLAHIGMADRTLGLLLLFPAILDLGTAFELSPLAISAMELVVFLVPQETWNLTYIVLPVSLFLSVLWIVFQASDRSKNEVWRYAVLAGAIEGAVLSLKSSFLPYVGALIVVSYILLVWKRQRRAIHFPIVEAAVCLLIIAAWMISMKRESGTFLFPLLGHGVDYSSYRLFGPTARFTSTRAVLRSLIQGIALLILAGIQYWAGIEDRKSRLSFCVLIAAAASITALNFSSGGDYVWRYNFAQFFSAVILFAAAGAARFSMPSTATRSRLPAALATLALFLCIFYYDFGGGSLSSFAQIGYDFAQYKSDLRASLTGQALASPALLAEYQAVERAIPTGATALENVSFPYLFNYRAGKTILLADWPGGAGPRPGWDFQHGGPGIEAYLLSQHVRYVVYDYHSPESLGFCRAIANLAHYSQLDHKLQILAILAHHQFDQLRAKHKSVYDNGTTAVVDLTVPIVSNHETMPDWTLHTSEAEMCAQIADRYISAHPLGTQHNIDRK